MIKTYRNIIVGLIVVGVVFGVLSLIVGNGKKEEILPRANTQCSTDQRVFDDADMLTDAEEEKLTSYIADKEAIIGADIVLMTINDDSIQGYDALRDYAQSFYEENGFGWDKPNGDGVIYVDNWATGDCWLCTTGKAVEKLDEDAINTIIDDTNETVNDDPYGAYTTMVDTTVVEMQGGMRIGGFWAFIIAFVIAVIFLVSQLINNKGEVTTTKSTYVQDGSIHILRKNDIFLHSHVTRTKIEKDHDSGSSGGTDGHGGGGGHH